MEKTGKMGEIHLQSWKNWLRKTFSLPLPAMLAVSAAAYLATAVSLFYTLPKLLETAAYLASSYALALDVTRITWAVQRIIRERWFPGPLRRLTETRLGRRLLDDRDFRTRAVFCGGAAFNLLFAGVHLARGLADDSVWFICLAGYYTVLVALRMLVVRRPRDGRQEWRRFTACGAVLLALNQALASIVIQMVQDGASFTYSGNFIYVMAIYSFYAVISAIVSLVRRGEKRPLALAAKIIRLTAAMVSMLALETAMIGQFSDGSDDTLFRLYMVSGTGGAVCLIVLGMAVYMLVRGALMLRKAGAEREADG